jgi:hypothetical protein
VTPTLRHHGSNEGLFTALLSGEEDYVLAGGDEVVQARSEGMDLVAIGQYYRSYPVTIIVPENSDIHTAADLAGRSIGVPGRFGESWFGLLAALAQAGLTQDDVSIVEIGYTQQAALTTGRVEAIIGFSNNDQVQFATAGIPTRTVPLRRRRRGAAAEHRHGDDRGPVVHTSRRGEAGGLGHDGGHPTDGRRTRVGDHGRQDVHPHPVRSGG